MAREMIDRRGKYEKHYDLGNGRRSAEVYLSPVHYQDDQGEWKDIKTNIVGMRVWEFTHGVVENLYHAYFNDTTSDNFHLVSFELMNRNSVARWINYKLKNSLPENYLVDGSKITYSNVFPNIDVEYIVVEEKLKENIILKSPQSNTEFIFSLKMDGSQMEKKESGDILFLDIDTGEELWKLDTPYMIDANQVINNGVEYVIGHDGTYDTLSLIITDTEFLESAVYPVIIDPTTTLQSDFASGKDTYVDDGVKSLTPGYQTYCRVRATSYYDWAFIDFFTELKNNPNIVVSKAELQLYQYLLLDSSIVVKTCRVIDPWEESLVNWLNKLDIEDLPIEEIIVNSQGWFTLNFKTAFSSTYYGICIKVDNEEMRFYSSDHTDPSLRPLLIIEYIEKPAIIFLDSNGEFFSDSKGNAFKNLDFGMMIAGQTSLPVAVEIKNYCGFLIKNLEVFINPDSVQQGMKVNLSRSNNPFIAEPVLHFNGIFNDEDSAVFYVRISSDINVKAGSTFEIKAKAVPA